MIIFLSAGVVILLIAAVDTANGSFPPSKFLQTMCFFFTAMVFVYELLQRI